MYYKVAFVARALLLIISVILFTSCDNSGQALPRNDGSALKQTQLTVPPEALNLGDVWIPGQPTMSLYQERLLLQLVDRLGYHLIQRLVWERTTLGPFSFNSQHDADYLPSVQIVRKGHLQLF